MGLFAPKPKLVSNTSELGSRTLAYIISRFVAQGYTVLVPFGEGHRYDLAIEDANGDFWRVQCKTGRYRRGCIEFNCYSVSNHKNGKVSRSPYTGQIHYFASYCEHTKKCYLVPADKTGTGTVMLRIDPPDKRTPPSRIRWAQDYEL